MESIIGIINLLRMLWIHRGFAVLSSWLLYSIMHKLLIGVQVVRVGVIMNDFETVPKSMEKPL